MIHGFIQEITCLDVVSFGVQRGVKGHITYLEPRLPIAATEPAVGTRYRTCSRCASATSQLGRIRTAKYRHICRRHNSAVSAHGREVLYQTYFACNLSFLPLGFNCRCRRTGRCYSASELSCHSDASKRPSLLPFPSRCSSWTSGFHAKMRRCSHVADLR